MKNKPAVADVKKFWDDQAKTFKESQLATAPDPSFRDLEIRSITARLKDGATVLDIGCGNGFSTFHFARRLGKAAFIGADYSADMIVHANNALKREKPGVRSRVSFIQADVLSLSSAPELKGKKFDYIVSERCLINLANWNEQRHALLEMRKLLKKNGRIILTENTQEGLARLNGLRSSFGLKPIHVRWHNYYMPEKKLNAFAKTKFHIESVENIGNLYYIVSRVIYAKLSALQKREPRYSHPINEIASKLPTLGSFHFSPNFIYVLRNKA